MNLNTGNRLICMLVDHMIMTLIFGIFVAPAIISHVSYVINNMDGSPKGMPGNIYLNIFAFSLYFNKDIYLGRSIAKRIFKFQIVNVNTNLPANPLQCFVRNITVIAWPIEVIVSMINNQRRVGDFITGTKLVTYNAEEQKAQPNWLLIILSLLASFLFTYLLLYYPMEISSGLSQVK